MVAKGEGEWGRDVLGVWNWQMQTIVYRMDKQQGPIVWYRELYSISCDKPNGKEYEKECMYVCIHRYIHTHTHI